MAKVIALFNHKGGVSKTTTTFNVAWMLAERGHRVVMVDADSQCNLTGMVLGYKGPTELEEFYANETERNLYSGLAPAFESRPQVIEPVECFPVDGRDGLFLLPGHLGIAEYEVTLAIAQELTGSIQTLQNLPGSIRYLLDRTAEHHEADFILVDMSPGLGAVNQNLVATSDFFLIPASPDFFSLMAMDSLARVFPRWQNWASQASSLDILRRAAYPFPPPHSKFLGTIIQKYRPRGGQPSAAFQSWIDKIGAAVTGNLFPALSAVGMTLPDNAYGTNAHRDAYCLATIPDFNSLIARSQEHQVPVFALTAEQLGQVGVVLEGTEANRDAFRATFSELTDKIVALTSDIAVD